MSVRIHVYVPNYKQFRNDDHTAYHSHDINASITIDKIGHRTFLLAATNRGLSVLPLSSRN